MRKSARKNPHAVALGRLGGLARSEAEQLANRENGRAGWPKPQSPVGATLVFVASSRDHGNRSDP
jgi:hypothetical protein